VLRIALRAVPDGAVERSYRVLVTEVPGTPQAGFTGAQFALKISLPIFVVPGGAATGAALGPRVVAASGKAPRQGAAEARLDGFADARQASSRCPSSTAARDTSRCTQLDIVRRAVRSRCVAREHVLRPARSAPDHLIKPAAGKAFGAGRLRVRAESDAGPLAADVLTFGSRLVLLGIALLFAANSSAAEPVAARARARHPRLDTRGHPRGEDQQRAARRADRGAPRSAGHVLVAAGDLQRLRLRAPPPPNAVAAGIEYRASATFRSQRWASGRDDRRADTRR
jgi:hypothetical protein